MSEQEAIEQIIQRTAELIARDMRGIVADRVYSKEEAAELIGFRTERGPRSILEIPRKLLPVIALTPGGRNLGYLGRDLLKYVADQRKTA